MRAVNLLTSEQRSVPKAAKVEKAPAAPPSGGSFGAYMVLGALAFAVLAVTMYVLAGNTVKDRKAELAQVSAEAQSVRAEAAKLKPYHDFQQLAAQRLQTVTDLASSRFDWERALGDMSRALPSDVHLKSMRGSLGSEIGGASNPLRGSVQAPAIELSGCTESQSRVARMMARLRAVRGVTRVSLAKSDKGNEASGPAVTATAGAEQPGSLCKSASPAAFEVVVFFERSVVAAGARPNTAAAPATPAQPGADPAQPGSTPAQPGSTPAQPGSTPAQPGTYPAQPGTTAPAQPQTNSTTQGVSAP